MACDEVIEVGALHIDLASELAEGNPALVTVLLELTAAYAQLFAHLFAGQVLVQVPATHT